MSRRRGARPLLAVPVVAVVAAVALVGVAEHFSPAAAPASGSPSAAALAADACHTAAVTYCVLNPDVTQTTIHQTICVSGWTATVRPLESYTESLKRQQIASEGLPGGMSSYEEDHRMPLELGGAPSDAMNLSPESPASPNPKDRAESQLREQVCAGTLTLEAAQQELVAQWLAAWPGYRG